MTTTTNNQYTTLTFGDIEVKLLFADFTVRPDHKTRIYVSGQGQVTEMEQPPISVKGVDPENDKLWRRYNKLELVEMRKVLDVGMDKLDSQIHTMPEKIKFSRHAGCSCPCSPGFVADRALRFGEKYHQVSDIWITRKPQQAERTYTMADFDTERPS